jgi:hypothetical protein
MDEFYHWLIIILLVGCILFVCYGYGWKLLDKIIHYLTIKSKQKG